MTVNVDEFLANATPRSHIVRVCMRGDLVTERDELIESLKEASNTDPAWTAAVAERLVAIEAEADESTLELRLESMGSQSWAALLRAHPPAPDDVRQGADHNRLTFPPAVIAACAVEPTLDEAQCRQLADTLPLGDWLRLWMAALALNVEPMPPLKATATARRLATTKDAIHAVADTEEQAS